MVPANRLGRMGIVKTIPIFIVISSVLAGGVFAMTAHLKVEEIAQQATSVVEGNVTNIHSEWSADHTYIHTWVSIAVSAVHKGQQLEKTLKLRVLGGEMDGIGMSVDDGASFAKGDHVMVFLGPNPLAYSPTIGRSQGLFKITSEAPGATEIATNGAGVTLSRVELLQRVAKAAGKNGGAQ